jgi:hypothetical protein
MDLNPYEFGDFNKMEFSNFCKNNNVDAIVFLTNWLDNEPDKISDDASMQIWNYWIARLTPYLKQIKPVYLLAANRCGKERDTHFIGCSSILKVGKDCELLEGLNKKEESIIFAKIII